MKKPLILVVGATGTVGSEVVKQLIEADQKVRALVRDPSKAAKFGDSVEIVKGDLSQPDSLTNAFLGVDKMFFSTAAGPDSIAQERNAYDAAKIAGVKHIVKLSGNGVDSDIFAGTYGQKAHGGGEKYLQALGTAWTILRPGPFFSNIIKFWGIMQQGGIFLPAGNGRDVHIDPRDIAAVAVKALTTSGHEGKIYTLTGPEILSYAEVVQKVSSATGKSLKYVDVPKDEWRNQMLGGGVPPVFVDTLLAHFAAVRDGKWNLTSTVSDLLGRPAHTFDEWINDHVAELK